MLDLIGRITPGGWTIVERVDFAPDHTGGYFSDCFYVEKGGHRAFLKALDVLKFDIFQLGPLLAGFDYESRLVQLSKDQKLNRVIQVLESDKIDRGDSAAAPLLRHIPFLVFEEAKGDIRETVDTSTPVTNQWRFYLLHQTTLGLLQLHSQAIAHQDLKPSNVLYFDNGVLKLGDLGRSSQRGNPAPHDTACCAGHQAYAPFEQRYAHLATDWVERRLSTDVFHLGCLTVFAFTNICFPQAVMLHLAEPYRPGHWGDSYPEVLPYIKSAMVETLAEIAKDFPEQFREELTSIVLDLCNPSPVLRGRNGITNQLINTRWLARYVTIFDRMEKVSRIRNLALNAQ